MEPKEKWFTIIYYIDEETGEVINKLKFKNNYHVTKKIKLKSIKSRWGNENHWAHLGRKTKQLKLFN